MRESYGGHLFYAVRQGETPEAGEVLDNRVAAQLITAIWLKEPWNAVRKLRLFDEDYHRVFTRSIDAHKLYLAHRLNEITARKRDSLNPELRSSFASVRFTIIYLVVQMMRQGGMGEELFANPQRWLLQNETDVVESLETFIEEAIGSTNFYTEDKEKAAIESGESFDPKVEFKSQQGIRGLERDVLSSSKRQARRVEGQGESYYFSADPSDP